VEVGKLVPAGRRADLVALNHRELSLWAGRDLPDRAETERAARELAGPSGTVVVTLGADGALLVAPDVDGALVHEPVDTLETGVLTVGAGDVHLACLLEARTAGADWPTALAHAADLTSTYLSDLQSDDHPYRGLRGAPVPGPARNTSTTCPGGPEVP
jgi:sugar/nucleoside kinase (ribokinase family)